jgi:hypothetical protein
LLLDDAQQEYEEEAAVIPHEAVHPGHGPDGLELYEEYLEEAVVM